MKNGLKRRKNISGTDKDVRKSDYLLIITRPGTFPGLRQPEAYQELAQGRQYLSPKVYQ